VRLWARGNLRIPGPEQPAPEAHLDEAFAAFGLVPEEAPVLEDDFFLWPENVAGFNLWLAIQTQWLSDMGSRTGLNYPGVDIVLRHLDAPKKEKRSYFATIQVLERAALEEWSRER
jgi:hypothetical protein